MGSIWLWDFIKLEYSQMEKNRVFILWKATEAEYINDNLHLQAKHIKFFIVAWRMNKRMRVNKMEDRENVHTEFMEWIWKEWQERENTA